MNNPQMSGVRHSNLHLKSTTATVFERLRILSRLLIRIFLSRNRKIINETTTRVTEKCIYHLLLYNYFPGNNARMFTIYLVLFYF